jgi:hypothetical protein
MTPGQSDAMVLLIAAASLRVIVRMLRCPGAM